MEHAEKHTLKLDMGGLTRSKERGKKMSQDNTGMNQADLAETSSINVKIEVN